jgi:hypothetical protein
MAKKCGYYLGGRYSQLYTDLYTELESGRPDIKTVYKALRDGKVLTLNKGQWWVRQGESVYDALAHINRVNNQYPGLITTEYKGPSKSSFGKEGNKIYKAGVNRFVLENIVPQAEQAEIMEGANNKEELSALTATQAAVSDQALADNTSDQSRGIVGLPEEQSVTQTKADRLKANFEEVGINVDVEFTDELKTNVSGDVVGNGARKATIRLNEEYLLDDTVYHEFGHVFVDLLGMSHPLIRQALKELNGSDLSLSVIDAYPHLDGVRLDKEILATAIGLEGAKIERKNPSKLQIILNKIFRAVGKIFGVQPNTAAQLAEQMFAGEIARDSLVGQTSPFVQESRNREKIDNLIRDTKILARNMANIAKSKGNEAAQARSVRLLENLEQVKQVEDFVDFIDTAGKATSNILNKFKMVEEAIEKGEEISTDDVKTVADLKQYLDGFEVLDALSAVVVEEEQVRAVPLQNFVDMSTKLKAVIAERKLLQQKYFEIGIPIIADWLSPFSVQEINTQLDTLIENIKTQNTGERHIEKSDNRYGALLKDKTRGVISPEEFDTAINDLAITQLEEKKTNRESLIALLTKASKDKSGFSYWFDPLIYSNDNAIQLFTKAVKFALRGAENETRDFLLEMQGQYREFVESAGLSENNVEKLNKQLLEEIVEYVRNGDTGKFEPITRVSFLQPYDIDKFKKNRKEAVEKASKKTNYYTLSDFETEEDFIDYKMELEETRVGGYTAARKAFNAEMKPWYRMNTHPVEGAMEVAKAHEKKIKKIIQEQLALNKKVNDNKATPTEIERLTVLEIELQTLIDWKNKNYFFDRFGDQSSPIVRGGLTRPATGEKGPNKSNKTDYTNAKYAALQKNPKFKKYYDFLWEKYKIAQDNYGNASNRMSKNPWDQYSYFIPSVRKTDKDRFIEEGGVDLAQELWKEGTDVVSTDTMYGDKLEGIGGQEYKVIPVRYANPLDKKDISYDLAGSIAQFTHMSNMFKAKSNIQGHVQMMVGIIGNRETSLTSPMGSEVMNVIAKGLGYEAPITKAGTETNNFKHLESFIDNVFFDVKSIKVQFGFLGKQFEANKVTGMIAGFTAMNALSMNLLQAVNQSTLDNLLGYAEAVAGQFYDQKSWARGKKVYWANSGAMADLGKMAPETWLGQLIDIYDPIQGKFTDSVGKNVTGSLTKKAFTTDALFFLQHGAEHELQVSRMLAMMEFTKAVDKDGKQLKNKDGSDMTILDAHKKDKKGRVRIDPRVANFNEMDFINRLHGLNKRTNGVYNDFDKAHLKRTFYGKLFLLFRGWMVPGIRRRFGHGELWHSDQEMGTLTQGSYITFYKMLRSSLMKHHNAYATMTDLEKQNVKRTMVEMGAFIGTVLIGMALSMGDDDEENGYATNFLLYQARRLQTELGAFTPIFGTREAVRLLESPTAGLRPIQGVIKLLDSTWKNGLYFASGGNIIDEKDIYFQRRSGRFEKGDAKIWKDLSKMIPALNGLEKNKRPEELLQWFNK